jgi:beta-fructofuranosidase
MRRRDFLASAALAPSAQDPDRPRYHFQPAANWMNDPNAPIYHNGEYHLYYQYNPNAAYWGDMHWGHTASKDLVHWKHLPIALAPTPGGPDKDGCFTGCMVIDKGKPVIIYTGVKPEVQCLAFSDDLITWRKYPKNPVIAGPPKDLDSPGFRDPQVWRDGDDWLMVIGAGRKGIGGVALLYSSKNLIDWKYVGPFLEDKRKLESNAKDPVASGEMWECPDFLPVSKEQWLFYIATRGRVEYFLGPWKERRFEPASSGTLVYGPYYAPKSSNAAGGRRIIWGWIQERRSREEQIRAGWSGAMSLPVVPGIGPQGLKLEPAREVEALRGSPVSIDKAPPLCCEIEAEIDAERSVLLTLGGQTLFRYLAADRVLELGSTVTQIRPEPGRPLRLRLFCDGSIFEAFVNERIYLVARLYGQRGPLAWAQAPLRSTVWPMNV